MIGKYLSYIRHPGKIFLSLGAHGFLNWIPDKKYIEIEYKIVTGKNLDLSNPKTYNEKLQWLKLYDKNPQYIKMVDKFEAKKYVAQIIGQEHIIPTYGVYNKFEEIDFNTLPNQFVLKCTHDSGGVFICRDKSQLDLDELKRKVHKALKRDYYAIHREWPYKDVKHRIIIEKYMDNGSVKPRDYKFFCFNGDVKCLYLSDSSHTAEQTLQFFDLDFMPMECRRKDYNQYTVLPEKPDCFDSMIEIAKRLSAGIPHVRVDLYEINGNIFFGEMTFFTTSGFVPFESEDWNRKFGDWIVGI